MKKISFLVLSLLCCIGIFTASPIMALESTYTREQVLEIAFNGNVPNNENLSLEDLEQYYGDEKSFGADVKDDDEDNDNSSFDDNETEEPSIDFGSLPEGLKDLIDAVKNNKIEISGFKITGDDLEKILGKKKKKDEKPEEIVI